MKPALHVIFIALQLTAFNILPADAQPTRHTRAESSRWEVLINDRLVPETATSPAHWSTIWSDGEKTTRLSGVVLGSSERLFRLTVANTNKTESCPNGSFPFSYSVDELTAQPLSGGTPRVWLGQGALAIARSAMRMHLASCKEFTSYKGSNPTADSYERTRIRFEALYGRYVGIEELVESQGHGQSNAIVLFDWGVHSLFSRAISRTDKRLLTKQEIEQAKQQYLKRVNHTLKEPRTSHLLNYVLVPSGGGAAAEFAIAESEKPPLNLATVRVKIKRDLLPWYDHWRRAFVAAHPDLIPWETVSFYTISPDKSAVVYEQDHLLYWQGLSSGPKRLSETHEVRGWQWHESRLITPAERSALSDANGDKP